MELPWELPPRLALLLYAAAGLTVAVGLAVGLRRGTVGLPRVLGALAPGLALSLLAALVARAQPHGFFAVLCVAFVQGAVALPLGSALLLFLSHRRQTRAARRLLLALLLPLPFAAWAAFVEPARLERIELSVPLPPQRSGELPLRVGVLSDLQCVRVGAHEHAAVELLLAGRPDLILLPGDLFQGPAEDWPAVEPGFRDLLRRLVAPGGAFLVGGDTDDPARLEDLVRGTPVRLLRNESVELAVGDRRVALFGQDLGGAPRATLETFCRSQAPGTITLLLTHRPGQVFRVPLDAPVDLLVAGHTHGGQLRLPFLPPPVDLSPVHNRIGGGGLHVQGVQRLYVSRGVGLERGAAPRVRFACRPEVSLLVLQ